MPTVNAIGLFPAGRVCPLVVTSIVGEFTLEQIVAYLWRVRKWRMEVDVEWDAEGSGQFFFEDSFEFDAVEVTGDFGEIIESERNLVCLRPQYSFFQLIVTNVGQLLIGFNSTPTVSRKTGTELYSTIQNFSLSPPNSFQISSDPNLLQRQDAGNLTVEFLNHVVNVPLYSNWSGGSSQPPQGAFILCNARVIADEYWPYAS